MSDKFTSWRDACPLIWICNISICHFVVRFASQDPSLVGKGAKAVFRDKEGRMNAVCTLYSLYWLLTHIVTLLSYANIGL